MGHSSGARRHKLLVVEDDAGLQRQLEWALDTFEVHCASSREEAIEALVRHQPAVILQDLALPPDENGVEEGFATIAAAHRIAPQAKIIVLTGQTGREHAVRAIAAGAHDYCVKPIDARLLSMLVGRAIRLYELEKELEHAADPAAPLDGIIAASASMLAVRRAVMKVAPTGATVLLLGESGTGKERVARALHALSPRAGKPLIALNCAAIPESLLESELFGHERGAFTGAVRDRIGQVERAAGGTLFLDEIGDMPLPVQAKLLRFLQDRVIERVGSRRPIPVDVRIVAATHRDLDTAIARGAFRLDLYHRLSEVSVTLPPLRERDSDAVLLATYFLEDARRRNGLRSASFAPDAVSAIESYAWPGNVRELQNRVTRAAILAEERVITAQDLGLRVGGGEEMRLLTLREARRLAEWEAAQSALALTGGNVSKAAERLGITRTALYGVMKRAQRLEEDGNPGGES